MPARSPCSVAPAAPTRTRTRWAKLASDVIGTPTRRRRSSATACAIDRARLCRGPRSTRPPRRRPSSCSGPTSRRSCRCSTCGCATPRQKRRSRSSSSRRAQRPARPRRGRRSSISAGGRSPRPSRAGAVTIRRCDRAQLGHGPWWSLVAGRRGQPRRAPLRDGRHSACLRGVCSVRCRRGAKVLPALRRGNVVGAIEHGPASPAQVGLRRQPDPARPRPPARSSCWCCSAADPLADFPDRDLARRALAGAPRVIAVDTFLTDVSTRRPTSCSPAAGVRREARHDHQPRGPGHAPSPEGHPAAAPPAGLDDRRRAGRAASAATSAVDGSTRSPQRSPQRRRLAAATPSRARRDADGIVVRAAHCRCHGRRPVDHRWSATATTTAWSSSRKLYDGAVGHRQVAVAGRPRRRAPQLHLHPLDFDRRRVRRRRRGARSPASGHRCVLHGRRRRHRRARHRRGCRSTSPARDIGELIDSTEAVTDAAAWSRSAIAGARPAASATSTSATC